MGESVAGLLAEASSLPRHEAERLLMTASGLARSSLVLHGDLAPDVAERFRALVTRRLEGRPLQYLEGTVQFGPLELAIDDRALIPRPETEHLWELVVRSVAEPPALVVDLCTGSGNLALACKHIWPDAEVHAVDLSPGAAALARENAARTGLGIAVHLGDLFDALPVSLRGRVDVIVANPPYVARAEADLLPAEVRDHEPAMALVAGDRGDEVLARIAAAAGGWLRPGGVVACEISEFRADTAARLFAPFCGEIEADLAGKPRYVIGRSPSVPPATAPPVVH